MDQTNLASKKVIRWRAEWIGDNDQARQKFQNNLIKEPNEKARRRETQRITEWVGDPD